MRRGFVVAISNSLPLNRFKDILNVKRVAVANPKTAPYGKAGVEAMKKAKFLKSLRVKLSIVNRLHRHITILLKGPWFEVFFKLLNPSYLL